MFISTFFIQVFNELVDQVDSWLSAKEAFLSNDELGSSMSEVESILRKHNAFENTIQRQSDKVTDLDKFAQRLIADQHYAANDIMARYDTVQSRLEHIQSRSSARKAQLEESERYQQFFKSLAEFNAWMEEKYQLAHDANWKDPVHLEHKLQKQTSFETELNANLGRMELLLKEGEAMIADDHFATEDIRQRVSDLTADWSDLLEASAEKRRRLLEVQTALRLNRRIDDFEGWLDSVETILKSEDVGGNLSTCLKLVEKTEATKLQVLGELATLTEINQQAEALADDEHFLSGEIRDRLLVVNKR
jgi:spectrin beta